MSLTPRTLRVLMQLAAVLMVANLIGLLVTLAALALLSWWP